MPLDGIDPFPVPSDPHSTPVRGVFGEEIEVTAGSHKARIVIEMTEGGEMIIAHLSVFAAQRLIEELQAAIDGAA